GFRETGLALKNQDGPWRVFRKSFDRGLVGLGVNGLDHTPTAHYVVFVRPQDDRDTRDRPSVEVEGERRASWRVVSAGPGVSAAFDADRPFDDLPDELGGSVMLQPSHSARHSTMLATGRVWKTHVVSGRRPDQVAISYGSDPARELVWTWRTSPEVASSAIR